METHRHQCTAVCLYRHICIDRSTAICSEAHRKELAHGVVGTDKSHRLPPASWCPGRLVMEIPESEGLRTRARTGLGFSSRAGWGWGLSSGRQRKSDFSLPPPFCSFRPSATWMLPPCTEEGCVLDSLDPFGCWPLMASLTDTLDGVWPKTWALRDLVKSTHKIGYHDTYSGPTNWKCRFFKNWYTVLC